MEKEECRETALKILKSVEEFSEKEKNIDPIDIQILSYHLQRAQVYATLALGGSGKE